jgi:hypothetical protein
MSSRVSFIGSRKKAIGTEEDGHLPEIRTLLYAQSRSDESLIV